MGLDKKPHCSVGDQILSRGPQIADIRSSQLLENKCESVYA